MSRPFARTQASVLLDLVRGLAALLVVSDHWRNLLFVDFPQLTVHRIWFALPYLLTSAGHQAVVIFFVLSGYLVGGSVLRSCDEHRWRWRTYLMQRLVRLWVVLAPGLLLCALWDRCGIWLARAPRLYGGANFNHLTPAVLPRLAWATFWGNLLFQGGIRVPTFGSDGPLWSLGFEAWYYLLFPLVWVPWAGSRTWAARFGFAGVLGAAALLAGPRVLAMFPVWLLGVVLARLPLPHIKARVRALASGVYVAFLFTLAKWHGVGGLISDYVLGLLTFAFFAMLLASPERASDFAWSVRGARGLARFSYTLYVAHLPFALLLTALVAGDRRFVPGLRSGFLAAGVLGATLLYSYALAALTEFRTDAVRRWVERQTRRFRAQRPQAPLPAGARLPASPPAAPLYTVQ